MAESQAHDWEWDFADRLEALRSVDRLRRRRCVEPIDATHVRIDGRVYVDFSSNDYLGLSHHPTVIAAWKTAADRWGVGSGASPLISGHGPAHASAERAIAQWKRTAAAILLPSGFQANVAAIQTLAAAAGAFPVSDAPWSARRVPQVGGAPQTGASQGRTGLGVPRPVAPDADGSTLSRDAQQSAASTRTAGVRFLIDKLAHASLLDAVRATGAPFRIFPHNHLGKLQRLLTDHPPGQRQVVLTESIFSMDGDAADLAGLAELKQSFPFFLLLDEAHASGVFGPGGAGLAAELNLTDAVDAYVVTLSKAVGVVGGAICGSGAFVDAVINLGRGLIFSTAVPPGVAAAAEAAIGVLADERRQRRLRGLSERLRRALADTGWHIPFGQSPIVPIVIGEEAAALAAADRLLEEGFLVPAVRPPAVPRGASRLRITLCSEHTDEEVNRLSAALRATPV